LEEEYQKLIKFFALDKNLEIKICLMYDPQEFKFFADTRFDATYDFRWLWATSVYGRLICIFAPSVCEKITTHKKEEMFKTLIHEMSHYIYANCRFNNNILNEGLAYYLSGQEFNIKDCPEEITSLKNIESYKTRIRCGFFLVKTIVENIENGDKKIIEFLTETKKDNSEENLNNKFFYIFNNSPTDLLKMKGGNINNG
jgi:hypothetical protein